MELLLGAGHTRDKRIGLIGGEGWKRLVTLDCNPDCKPDVVADLESLPLPFSDNTFDEIHAYHVLEHTGRQGDWRFFFNQFMEFWRILKPGGFFMGIVPPSKSVWAWGDPGHSRLFSLACLTFLSQKQYELQAGKTAMSDYRRYWKGDFEVMQAYEDEDEARFVLRAIKA